MPTVMLTPPFIKAIHRPRTRIEYLDKLVPGLALRVTPTGAKTFAIRYRNKHGRQRRLTLGDAAILSLADARDRARDELFAAGKGDDPASTKQEEKRAETVADLAALYIDKHAKPKKRSWRADDQLLKARVLPAWKHRAIAEIKRRDVITLVERVADDGAPILANRVVALVSKLFAFALDRDLVDVNPASRIKRPGHEQARDRVLTDDELRTLWTEFDALDELAMAAFYKLRLLTMQRGGEVSTMRWADLDLAGGWWTVPATYAKNKLAHRVPLTPSTLAIIRALQPTDTDKEKPVFVVAGARGKRQQAVAADTFTVADFRGHDLRRTAASRMASGGIPRVTIAKLLNHVERSVTAVYDRHSYDAEKAAALAWWDRKLAAILADTSASVLPFQRGA